MKVLTDWRDLFVATWDTCQIVKSLVKKYGLQGLFSAQLLSYSILPFPPEPPIVLSVLLGLNPLAVLVVSLLGATIGSILTYLIGLKGIRGFLVKRSPEKEEKARKFFEKWGPLSLVLFSWLPILGDPLIIVAGTLKMNFWKFFGYSTLCKLWYFMIWTWFGDFLPKPC